MNDDTLTLIGVGALVWWLWKKSERGTPVSGQMVEQGAAIGTASSAASSLVPLAYNTSTGPNNVYIIGGKTPILQ